MRPISGHRGRHTARTRGFRARRRRGRRHCSLAAGRESVPSIVERTQYVTKYTCHVVSIGAASSEHFKIAFLHHSFVEQLPLISRKRALETSPLDGREAGLFIFKSRHAEVQLNRASETVYVGFNESGWAKSRSEEHTSEL